MAKCNLRPVIAPVSDAWKREISAYAAMVESQYKLPPGMLVRMMQKESRFDPNAFNPCTNAVGIVQQTPDFVRDLNGARFKYPLDPLNPKIALIAAAKYLAFVYRITKGVGWDLPLIAYNYGEGNMRAYLKAKALYGDAKLPAETKQYIAFIAPDFYRG